MRTGALGGCLVLVGVLLLGQLGDPPDASSLSCPVSRKEAQPPPPAPVYSAELRANTTALDAPGSVDLEGRFSYAVCAGPGPSVVLEARVGGGEFAPVRRAAVYRTGMASFCTPVPGTNPPVSACTSSWGNEEAVYVAAVSQTTEYRLRVGPLVSKTVTVTVANPSTEEERCAGSAHATSAPQLVVTPERTRIVFGESVRVRARFAYERCGVLLRPASMPGIESRRIGAIYPNQPAQHLRSGPLADASGDLVYEFTPPETTDYRIFYLGSFGEFARVEVSPKLELETSTAAGGYAQIRVQARATSSFRGASVRVERRTAGGWHLLRTVTLDRTLAASVRVRVSRGDKVRAATRGTSRYAPARSEEVSVP